MIKELNRVLLLCLPVLMVGAVLAPLVCAQNAKVVELIDPNWRVDTTATDAGGNVHVRMVYGPTCAPACVDLAWGSRDSTGVVRAYLAYVDSSYWFARIDTTHYDALYAVPRALGELPGGVVDQWESGVGWRFRLDDIIAILRTRYLVFGD